MRERGSAGEQCSYYSEDEYYDEEGSAYSSERQRYYNERNGSKHGSAVRSQARTPTPKASVHDY